MKKLIGLLAVAGIVFLSCGPSAEEKAAKEQRIADSIAQVQTADSLAEEEEEEAMRIRDSIKQVEYKEAETLRIRDSLNSIIYKISNITYYTNENFEEFISFDIFNNSSYTITNVLIENYKSPPRISSIMCLVEKAENPNIDEKFNVKVDLSPNKSTTISLPNYTYNNCPYIISNVRFSNGTTGNNDKYSFIE